MECNSSRWSTEETDVLLDLWSSEEIQDVFDGTVRDAETYKKLASMLQTSGYTRTAIQVKTRIKTLKKLYREQKDKLAQTGTGNKVKFVFFKKMDAVLGHREASAPSNVLQSEIPGLQNIGKKNSLYSHSYYELCSC